jgi:hypothetical protein
VDITGQGVPNARVATRGAEVGVTTNEDGIYCLRVPDSEQRIQLHVTAEGYQDQTSPNVTLMPGRPERINVILVQRFAEEVTVTGRADSLVGVSASASEGSVGASELQARPLLRSADLIEVVPGVAMTQHSTGGHAPIILLRGYNLDHGTDFATFLEGVPLNLPSHGHAQGYTDLNFLVTEAIDRIDFQKGPYSAAVGDFSTAGAANIELADTVPRPFGAFETGPNAFFHGVGGASVTRGRRRFLVAGEAGHYDGPSVVPDDFLRAKGLFRYSTGDALHSFSLSALGYGSSWNATDGYPERALERGYITRFGTLDPTDGGRTQQHLAIASWRRTGDSVLTRFTVYGQYADFDLFSNLTFWTLDSRLGDQIQQSDKRFSSGLVLSQKRFRSWSGRAIELTLGSQLRNDRVRNRLFNTYQRSPMVKQTDDGRILPARVYDTAINETSLGPYVEAKIQWSPVVRSVLGMRGDVFHMRIGSDRSENSGHRTAGVISPKLGVVFGPWRQTEFYVNGGYGFHSNHANGVVQHVDPATGSPFQADGERVVPTDPIVRTRGAEVGVRTLAMHGLQSSISLWIIDSDSELIYTPEDGFTAPERPGRRFGVEWNNFYRPRPWLAFDFDAAWSSAEYRIDPNGEGRLIPDAIQGVVSSGVAVTGARVSASLRGRYIGRRPLVSNGEAYSQPSFVLNGQFGIRVNERMDVGIEAFNLLNREYDDIAYYFPTRLRDPRVGGQLEPEAQPDYVTHPGEPRTIRAGLRVRF